MKITLLVILFTAVQMFANGVYSQNKRITLVEHNKTIEDVLQKIEEQSSYSFLYNAKLIDVKQTVNVNVNDLNLEKTLDALLKNTSISYKIFDKQVVLSLEKKANVAQQLSKISGNVTDSDGEALPGVSIVVKGTTIGTTTDFDGNFNLENIAGDAVLVFSFIGMQTQEVPVAGQSFIKVGLQEDAIGLEEIVAVGYGVQKKVNLTGAVSTVSAEKIESRPIATAAEGIQGLIPNLNVTFNSGDPGNTGAKFNVRGYTSLNGGGPLILVDGVQMNLEIINPEDIENITVLKDAASAAIYGARAAYGVVLVTTKKGKVDKKTRVDYSYTFSMNKPAGLPDLIDNSYDYAVAMNKAMQNYNGTDAIIQSDLEKIKAYYEDPKNNPEWEVIESDNGGQTFKYYGYTDWKEELLRNYAPSHKHNISVSGGNEKTTFYGSVGYFNQEGLFKNGTDEFERFNVRLNLDNQVNDWAKLNLKMVYNGKQTDKPHVYKSDENYINSIIFSRPTSPKYYPGDESEFKGMPFANPATYQELAGRDLYSNNDLWLTSGLEIDIIDNLKFKTDFTYNVYNSLSEQQATKIQFLEGDFDYTYGQTGNDYVYLNSSKNQYYAYNAYFQYEKTLLDKHFISGTAGYNQENKKYQNHSSKRMQLISNNVPTINLATGEQSVGGGKSEWAIRGAFYRLNYIYADKYLVEFNGRYDGTSKFPKKDRFGFFPSFSLGWRVSEEPFFPVNKDVMNNLKLRASYGSLGNQAVNSLYPYVPSMNSGTTNYILGDTKQLYIKSPGLVSPTLTWEEARTVNFGVDLAFFNSKLDVSFDKYTRTTSDILMNVKYPDLLGASAPRENAAEIKTKGWELTVNWRDKIGSDFSYELGLVLSDFQGEVTKYDNPSGSLSEYYVGKNLGEFWGYETQGIFQSAEEVAAAPNQSYIANNWKPGDIQYADLNDDKVINKGDNTLDNPGDQKVIGNTTPRYSFGITGGAEYKRFYMNFIFQGIGKRDVFPGGGTFWPFSTQWFQIQKHHVTDSWSEDNRDAYFARPIARDSRNKQTQSRYVQDASYIRLKSLTVGYNLPKRMLSNLRLSNARIFFSGQNLWEHSNVAKPYDPEFVSGSSLLVYPLQRTFAFGVNITY